ncbi:MAG TPA: LLM class flavin-dependent oxidoreductase [Pseudonocardiaceae bacterium]|jgi:alkanesulfonate monooxygenase SsuD/methylene tetrahydromethanopterin reductase-like flavin-dependent oxidoreductase (luciferase family)|nr:LLM class flavin-dependent oxidoreductase [Pseudonocardiaceae bacterium]
MKYAVVLPGGTASQQREHAALAERAGWDGVFVWESAYGVDAWSLLAAMATVTERIRLGTMLTPLPWRRPWLVAGQVATVNDLSGGRAVLAIGVGAIDSVMPDTYEESDLRTRAEMMDEGIDLMRTLWSGGTTHTGKHYRYSAPPTELPAAGHIPIWVVGVWQRPKSMRRVLRCDGVIPQFSGSGGPDDVRALRAWLTEHGGGQDIVVEGETPADGTGAAQVTPWAEAGATWWMETRWSMPHHSDERMREIRARIEAGPPVS